MATELTEREKALFNVAREYKIRYGWSDKYMENASSEPFRKLKRMTRPSEITAVSSPQACIDTFETAILPHVEPVLKYTFNDLEALRQRAQVSIQEVDDYLVECCDNRMAGFYERVIVTHDLAKATGNVATRLLAETLQHAAEWLEEKVNAKPPERNPITTAGKTLAFLDKKEANMTNLDRALRDQARVLNEINDAEAKVTARKETIKKLQTDRAGLEDKLLDTGKWHIRKWRSAQADRDGINKSISDEMALLDVEIMELKSLQLDLGEANSVITEERIAETGKQIDLMEKNFRVALQGFAKLRSRFNALRKAKYIG